MNSKDNISSSETTKSVSAYLQTKLSEKIFAKLNFEEIIIYDIKNAKAVKIFFNDKPHTSEYILLGSEDLLNWEGNFVSVQKTNSAIGKFEGTITLTDLNGQFIKKIDLPNDQNQRRHPNLNFGTSVGYISTTTTSQSGYPLVAWFYLLDVLNISNFPYGYYIPYDDAYSTGSGGGSSSGGPVLYFVPNQSDTIRIDPILKDSFPCFDSLIRTQFPDINAYAQSALYYVFGVSKYVHLKIEIDYTLDSADADAFSSANIPTSLSSEDTLNFSAKIQFNPWVLKNSSNEYIIATLIHEAIHGYINYKYAQYRLGIIDSNVIKTLFPLFWETEQNGGNLRDATTQHSIMAAQLIDEISTAIRSYNPNVTDTTAKALAWGGLRNSTLWKTKNDTCNIYNINYTSRTNPTSPFLINGCSIGKLKWSSLNFTKCY